MQIRFCLSHERTQLQRFIRREWSADHIFVHSPALLDYQHGGSGRINFVVAVDEDGVFQAVLGFIPSEHFQSDDGAIWLALWKTASHCAEKSIGLKLLRFLETTYPQYAICTAGISAQARLIYKALRFDVVTLGHYYLRVSEKPGRIAVGLLPFDAGLLPEKQYTLSDGAGNHEHAPSSAYYRRRRVSYFHQKYARHPIYPYHCVHSVACDLTLVYRTVEVTGGDSEGSKVMRIVDGGGNLRSLPALTGALFARARTIGADYIDLLAHLPDVQPILQAGFRKVTSEIVPNYFEPFLQKNVTIECALKGCAIDGLTVMKGDGDQDRPSRIPGINA